MLTVSTTGLFCSPGLRSTRLRLADLLRQRELLRVDRSDFERRGARDLGRAVGILRLLVDGDDADVLEQDVGQLRVAGGARVLARDQDVDGVAGLDEAGDAGHVVDADGRGAHAVGQQGGDRAPCPTPDSLDASIGSLTLIGSSATRSCPRAEAARRC